MYDRVGWSGDSKCAHMYMEQEGLWLKVNDQDGQVPALKRSGQSGRKNWYI